MSIINFIMDLKGTIQLAIFVVLAYVVYRMGYHFYMKPYLRVRHFLNKGGIGHFTYGAGFFFELYRNAVKYGNSVVPFLTTMKDNPNTKFLVRSLGSQPLLILTDINLVKQFLQNQHDFDKSWHFKELWYPEFSKNIFLSHGDLWKQRRRRVTPHFKFETLHASVPMVIKCVKKTYEGWIKQNKMQQNAIDMFGEVSGEVILQYLFNTTLDAMRTKEGKSVITVVHEATKLSAGVFNSFSKVLLGGWFVRLGLVDAHKRFLSKKAESLEISRKLIEEGRNQKIYDSFLYSLTEQVKEKDSDYTNADIAAELARQLIAGTDTNAHNIGFTIYHLYNHPDVLKKLLAEIDDKVPDFDKLDLDLLNSLDYTNAVIKEALRLTPPVPFLFMRDVTTKSYKFDDSLTVNKGDLVTVFFWMFHLSDKYFSQPTEYIPERWLPDGPFPNDGWKKEPYAFMPFSSGPRNCIGQHLAMIEAKVMLILFVKTFKFKFPSDYELKLTVSNLAEPIKPMIVTLEPMAH